MRAFPFIAPALALLLLAACGPSPQGGEKTAASAAAGPSADPGIADEPGSSSPGAPTGRLSPEAAKGEAGARELLRSWEQAVEERAFPRAYALYGEDGPPDGTSEADFAAEFGGDQTLEVEIGTGRVEGAAGSLYYAVPFLLSGARGDDGPPPRSGTIALRRVNDVPGAPEWQLAWHIAKIEWND